MTAGTVLPRDMGTITKELGQLEVVLETQAALQAKEEEARDLEEVNTCRY